MTKPCQHRHLKAQFSQWVSQRIMEHLVQVQGLKYSVTLCGGIQNEADLHQRFLRGQKVILETMLTKDKTDLIVRVWAV